MSDVAAIIAHDMAMKCGDDVAEVIRRGFMLADSQASATMAATAATGMAMAYLAGALLAETGTPPTKRDLDQIWKTLLRPLALAATGDRKNFERMVQMLASKPRKVGDPA